MKINKIRWILSGLLLASVLVLCCTKTRLTRTTSTSPNITDYLKNDSLGRFTELMAIIEKADYATVLNTYGTYTFFAPTNEAIDGYLKDKKLSSIDQLSKEDLQKILQFHLLEETLPTSTFTDGKLASITDYGQFLITGVKNINGVSSYIINRQALVTQANIVVGNGIIHAVDHVLTPSVATLAQLIIQDTSYSIFTNALKETGYFDTLSAEKDKNGDRIWLTLIAQKNKTYRDSGILNYAALKAKYCNTGNPKNAVDSLHLYVAYHILPDIKYLADIVTSNSQVTLAPLEVITDKFVNDTVLINDDSYSTIDGIVKEPGIKLDQSTSDKSATNGVLHTALGGLKIKVRAPFPVYWDLCATQPELTRLSSIYRKQTFLFDYGEGKTFKGITWEKSCLKYRAGVKGYLGDYWQVGMGRSSSNTSNLGTCSGNSWIEFTTPLLVKGKYKVWFCYYAQNKTTSAVQALFDSVPLTSALIQFNQKISSVDFSKEASLAAIGWKWWAGASEKAGATAARMLGVVTVKETGQHKLRFQLVSGSNADCNFDMVHFIPVDWPSQTSPRFNKDGSVEY